MHSEKKGVFDSLWISDEIKNSVVETDLWVKKGDKVGGFSAANEAIGTLVLNFTDKTFLDKVMSEISKYVQICLKESK